MEVEEAKTIFHAWQDFMEIADKFLSLMLSIPESFLPYPIEALEEGLNIMAKFYFDSGDEKTSELIKTTVYAYLGMCKKDEEALELNKNLLNMMFENPDLKKTLLEKLHEVRDQWIILRG